jgi:branched-chain amino acid transport system permease protein
LFLEMLVIGTVIGSMYGFVAFGVVLVYRTTRVLNVAHAGIGVMTGFICWDLVNVRGVPYYLAMTIAILAAALLGFLFDALVLRWMAGQPILQTGATFVLAIVLGGVTSLPTKWTEYIAYELPTPLRGRSYRVPLANHYLTYDELVLLGAMVVFTAAAYWMLRRTRPGIALRALADDPATASILGIRRRWPDHPAGHPHADPGPDGPRPDHHESPDRRLRRGAGVGAAHGRRRPGPRDP